MFTRLLIPLDGSQRAESVLPAAEAIARQARASVTLLHVIEPRPPAQVHGEHHLATAPEGEAYLTGLAARAFAGLPVRTHVHGPADADVAASIARHTVELSIDMIVLCTHGRGRARDLLYGSVAQQVLRRGQVPVLLVRADGSGPAFTCRLILVPLDGSPSSEAAVPAAEFLARAFGSRLRLLTVVPTVGTITGDGAPAARLLPAATAAALEMEEEGAHEYLSRLGAKLQRGGLVADAEVARGDPAVEVLGAIDRTGADLVVMATHGRSGLSAAWAGSVASRITARCHRPILLVPAPGAPQVP
jgi:nucleotide-binding universal stress UspA family protein